MRKTPTLSQLLVRLGTVLSCCPEAFQYDLLWAGLIYRGFYTLQQISLHFYKCKDAQHAENEILSIFPTISE